MPSPLRKNPELNGAAPIFSVDLAGQATNLVAFRGERGRASLFAFGGSAVTEPKIQGRQQEQVQQGRRDESAEDDDR